MKIKGICVENFRGIRKVRLENLSELVIVAGQNGSGKFCIFDAIRLIKSVYGGYQPNEYHQWFGEFQINFSNDPLAFSRIFNDRNKRLLIQLEVELHSDEKRYLIENASQLIAVQAWKTFVPELIGWRNMAAAPLTTQFRAKEEDVKEAVERDLQIFNHQIKNESHFASIVIDFEKTPIFDVSKVVELAFSSYEPQKIGIIDYHGAHRMYSREQLNTINVNLDAIEEQKRQSALYNYNAKYSNVKSEMAALYVREALALRAGASSGGEEQLTTTLKEMFAMFFPEKQFHGPVPTKDGSLSFPVTISGHETHDLDELSSGEKEILYGYLRLRTSAPKNSVVLLDEPELHLNPRLSRNLPEFYHRHIAKALGNQVWLVTHSDAILRESVGRKETSIFHMIPSAYLENSDNQAKQIHMDEDLERAIVDLVGDLAAYSPGGKVVIFEGEESDFDVFMTSSLFPEVRKLNAIPGTNKTRVRSLHTLLDRLQMEKKLPAMRVFSITDRDSDTILPNTTTRFTWDRYHIENYLLEADIICGVLADLFGKEKLLSREEVEAMLAECAKKTITKVLVHEVCTFANREIVSAVNTKINPSSNSIAEDLIRVLTSSAERIGSIIDEHFSREQIEATVVNRKTQLEADIETGNWVSTMRGRDVLHRFVSDHGSGISYEQFRNLVLAKMRDVGFQPAGMKAVLMQIVAPQPLAQN